MLSCPIVTYSPCPLQLGLISSTEQPLPPTSNAHLNIYAASTVAEVMRLKAGEEDFADVVGDCRAVLTELASVWLRAGVAGVVRAAYESRNTSSDRSNYTVNFNVNEADLATVLLLEGLDWQADVAGNEAALQSGQKGCIPPKPD